MEFLTGLAPLGLLVLLAAILISRGMRTKPDGSNNTESHGANMDD